MNETRIAKLVLVVGASLMLASAEAVPFASRPALTNGNYGVDVGMWSGKGLRERFVALNDGTPVLPRASSQQSCVISFKGNLNDMIGSWVDTNFAVSGSFNNWFTNSNSDFPFLSRTTLVARCNFQTNWFDATPWSGLMTNANGWPGWTQIMSKVIWSKSASGLSHTTTVYCAHNADVTSYATTGTCDSLGPSFGQVFIDLYDANAVFMESHKFDTYSQSAFALAACSIATQLTSDADFYYYDGFLEPVSSNCTYVYQFTLDHSNVSTYRYTNGMPYKYVTTKNGNTPLRTHGSWQTGWDGAGVIPDGDSGACDPWDTHFWDGWEFEWCNEQVTEFSYQYGWISDAGLGYGVKSPVVLLKWNVSGGFAYLNYP